MARLLRLEFAGALYHLTSRGDRREVIYRTDEDREAWLEVLGNAVTVFKGGDDPGVSLRCVCHGRDRRSFWHTLYDGEPSGTEI